MEVEKENKNATNTNKDLTSVVRKDREGAEGPNTQTKVNNAQEEKEKEKILYEDRTMTIVKETANINGRDFEFLKIEENDAVVVLAVIDNHIILVKQYRPASDKYFYELPAGHREKNESPENAAIREMQEETGYTPKKVSLMFKGYPIPGTNTMMVSFYLAEGLSKGTANPEPDEDISVVEVSLEDAIEMIRSGEITDLKTIACLLYYYYIFKNGR